ncbi:MAG: hypothetical protein ACI4M3_08130 [Acutalibacteraceae bacterium]
MIMKKTLTKVTSIFMAALCASAVVVGGFTTASAASDNSIGIVVVTEIETESRIPVIIKSVDMDGRIDYGKVEISGKLIAGYDKYGKPVYEENDYEYTTKLARSNTILAKLPANIDCKTVKINVGYEGMGASKNHNSIVSYSLDEDVEKIMIKMEGFTKWWGGYRVEGSIFVDGRTVQVGEG